MLQQRRFSCVHIFSKLLPRKVVACCMTYYLSESETAAYGKKRRAYTTVVSSVMFRVEPFTHFDKQ